MDGPMIEGSAQKPARNPNTKDRAGAAPAPRPGSQDMRLPFSPQETAPRLKAFLDLVAREMALTVHYDIAAPEELESIEEPGNAQRDGSSIQKSKAAEKEEAGLLVRFSGEDEEILLARNGELLLALEYLAHRWLRLPPALHDRVRFECGDFRANRLEELKLSARVAAQRVRETGQPFPFNPMTSRDRRTIHLELTGAPGVRTISEGSGDRRHLVIYPANKK